MIVQGQEIIEKDGKTYVAKPPTHYSRYKNNAGQWFRIIAPPYEVEVCAYGNKDEYKYISYMNPWIPITEDEVLRATLTRKDMGCFSRAFKKLYKEHGYEGDLPKGIGNALRVFVRDCPEYSTCVRQGPFDVSVRATQRFGYLFKSPIPGFSAIEVLKLCKMLKKNGKRYAETIKRLAEHPEEAEQARGLLALETLAEGFNG